MRFVWLLYVYMGLFAVIGLFLYRDIHYFSRPEPKTYVQHAVICDKDCPLDGLRLFLDKDHKLYSEANEELNQQRYFPAGTPVVLTVHPEARYWRAHALLGWVNENYLNTSVYLHIGETLLPTLDMPYWPDNFDFDSFDKTSVRLQIGPAHRIVIEGVADEFDRLDQAMERVLAIAKNPDLKIRISDDADYYTQFTARHMCETTPFSCMIE